MKNGPAFMVSIAAAALSVLVSCGSDRNASTGAIFGASLPPQAAWVSSSGANGHDWTAADAEPGSWNSVAYGNGLFVAVGGVRSGGGGTLGYTLVSPDGTEWTAHPIESSAVYRSVAYGNGLFVAVGQGRAMTSPDGIEWTPRTPLAGSWNSVAYGNGLFVAVSDNKDNSTKVMTSPDGITWTARESLTGTGRRMLKSVAYGNGLFVAVRDDTYAKSTDRVITSPDGITWTARAAEEGRYRAVAHGNGLFVAVGDDGSSGGKGSIMTSANGIDWTPRYAPVYRPWQSVAYGNGLFVAVGDGAYTVTSTDGANWTAKNGQTGSWRSIAYGDGVFAAVGHVGHGNPDGTPCVMTFAP